MTLYDRQGNGISAKERNRLIHDRQYRTVARTELPDGRVVLTGACHEPSYGQMATSSWLSICSPSAVLDAMSHAVQSGSDVA